MLHNRKTTPLRTILENCLTHIDQLEANRSSSDYYEKEFQDLKHFSESLKGQIEYACTEGEKEVNRKKNRYKDILPFNGSRVSLAEVIGVSGSDYVNANYIKGASGSPAYIASQGPLPNTVVDFWRMVVECEVQVIVMACNAEEAGKHKCENYWVERENEPRTFGSVEITLVKANIICPDFLVRTMLLKYTNDKGITEERTICQFHYSAWPDHGVPPLVRPLLDMVRLVRDTQASETLPVLVHCSAGCGRTGTICAIDFVWGLLRLGKLSADFSLFNLVRDMRKQRVAMVQTKEQYILVHQAVRELFKEQLQIIDSHHYENVSSMGEPLMPEAEPIYETLSQVTVNGEKQDWSKVDIMDVSITELSRKNAPPLPRKKCATIPSSKQEKEVENLTEKNRIAVQMKDNLPSENLPDNSLLRRSKLKEILPSDSSPENSVLRRSKPKETLPSDSSPRPKTKEILSVESSPESSVLRRPKMTKLKALFERGTPTMERQKPRSHTISRSHSLGPVRKPLLSEVLKTPETKKSKDDLPIRSGGKLKVPKLITPTPVVPRPVAQVKRSKSLKATKESTPLLTLIQYTNLEDLKDEPPKTETPRRTITRQKTEIQATRSSYEQSRRRRSLESLLGEEASWSPWMPPKQEQPTEVSKQKPGLSLKHQFQLLSHASQRTMNSLASGLGIRERRNSFRQAVIKQDSLDRVSSQFGSEGRFVSVPEDSASSVLVDGSYKPHKDALTVRSQNGDILEPSRDHPFSDKGRTRQWSDGKEPRISASASMRLPAKNRFLYRLKTELQTTNHYSTETQHETTNDYSTTKNSPSQKTPDTPNHYSSAKSSTPETNHYSTVPAKSSTSQKTPENPYHNLTAKGSTSQKPPENHYHNLTAKGSSSQKPPEANHYPNAAARSSTSQKTPETNHYPSAKSSTSPNPAETNHYHNVTAKSSTSQKTPETNHYVTAKSAQSQKTPDHYSTVAAKSSTSQKTPETNHYVTAKSVQSQKTPDHYSTVGAKSQKTPETPNHYSTSQKSSESPNHYSTVAVKSPLNQRTSEHRPANFTKSSPIQKTPETRYTTAVRNSETNHYSAVKNESHYSTVPAKSQKSVDHFSTIPGRSAPTQKLIDSHYSTVPTKSRHFSPSEIYSSIQSPQGVKTSYSEDAPDGSVFKTPDSSKRPLARTGNIEASIDYLKNRSPNSRHGDLYGSYYPRSGYLVQRVGKSSSASSQSSDNLSDCPKKSPLLLGRVGNRHRGTEVGSESSSSSGARELLTVLRPMEKTPTGTRDLIWNSMSRSKSTSQVIEEIRGHQPVAPPRIRRRTSAGGTTVSRHSSIDLLDHSNSSWSVPSPRNTSDNSEWCGALGVDLDAVAASMQRTKHTHPGARRTVLSDSEMNPSPPPVSLKKQQYL